LVVVIKLLDGWLDNCMVGWIIGWLVKYLDGWLDNYKVGWMFRFID